MRVLSWDPGIINLAYCLVDYNSMDDFKILRWKNWDLLKRPTQCNGYSKDGSICTFKPIYTVLNKGYCKKHTKSFDLPDYTKLYKELLPGHKCDICGKKGRYKLIEEDSKLCMDHYKRDIKVRDKTLKPVEIKVACKKISTTKIQIMLIKKLDKMLKKFDDDGIEIILIENQIAKLAPKMKAIASTLMDYFLIRKELDGYFKNIKEICFFNPNNKIWVKKGNLVSVPKSEKSYKKNKNNSVKYCQKLLKSKEMHKDLEYLNVDKKKDDKADALLQCIYKMSRLNINKSNKKRGKKDKG